MPAMTVREFVDTIAVPTVLELKNDRQSRRRAYLACITTFHVKDHLRNVVGNGVEAATRARAGGLFDVVRGVCNGTKHVQTDGSHPYPFVAGADWKRPKASLGIFQFGVSRFGDTEGGREIIAGHDRVDLYDACAAVLRAYVDVYPQHLGGCDLSGL